MGYARLKCALCRCRRRLETRFARNKKQKKTKIPVKSPATSQLQCVSEGCGTSEDHSGKKCLKRRKKNTRFFGHDFRFQQQQQQQQQAIASAALSSSSCYFVIIFGLRVDDDILFSSRRDDACEHALSRRSEIHIIVYFQPFHPSEGEISSEMRWKVLVTRKESKKELRRIGLKDVVTI